MSRPHYWWNVTDLKGAGFIAALEAAGPNAILRFHKDTQLFTIEDPDAVTTQSHEGDDGYNFVHVCPPDCP
jgi:hypothetical protein